MKLLRLFFCLLLFTTVDVLVSGQTTNKLYIPDITSQSGSNIQIPVCVDNMSEIVALQFDLVVPEGVSLNGNAVLTDRSSGHSVVARNMGGNVFRVISYSAENAPYRGNSGDLFYISASVSKSMEEGSVHKLEIKDAVLGAETGENVMSSSEAGSLTIVKSPDLALSDISFERASIAPGEKLDINWLVSNIGGLPTTAGWKEQVFLTSGTKTKLIGTVYYDKVLPAGGNTSRQISVTLPDLLGIDGEVKVMVKLTPDSDAGEPVSARANNTLESNGVIQLSKRLFLALPADTVSENVGVPLRYMLSRSGSDDADEVFMITVLQGDSRLSMPESVTLKKGQSSVYFYASVADNEILDESGDYEFGLSGNGYEAVNGKLAIVDDELPVLRVSPSREEITEGESFTLTITAQRAPKTDIMLGIYSEALPRFSFPATVKLPANTQSVVVDVEAIDNNEVESDINPLFEVSADGYESGNTMVTLKDNDLPKIELTLTPEVVNESAGANAVMARLRRLTNTDSKVTIKLSDTSGGKLVYNNVVVLDKGVEEAQFSIGVVDNTTVDGDMLIDVTAAVYISSCSCTAGGTSVGVVTSGIKVVDDDGPSLSLSARNATWLEGGDRQILTVSRNTSTDVPLTVTLSSDNDDKLEYEHTVILPVGAVSAEVSVTVKKNDGTDDSTPVVFTAAADGHSQGNCWVIVSDQTLPDAVVSEVRISESKAEVGETLTATVRISNNGYYPLPETAKVGFYVKGVDQPVAVEYLQNDLPAGESVEMETSFAAPSVVGMTEFYAVANDGQKFKELLFTNNSSEAVPLQIVSPFSISLQTDKSSYGRNENIVISGKVSGRDVADKSIELYVINEGSRYSMEVTTDSEGAFTADYKPYNGQIGRFDAGACYVGEGSDASMASFYIYGLRRTSSGYVKCELVTDQQYECDIELENPSDKELTGIGARVVSMPDDCDITVSIADRVAGNGKTELNLSLVGKRESPEDKWYPVDIEISSAGAEPFVTTVYYFIRSAKGKLKASVGKINSTVNVSSSRYYPFSIVNVGHGNTGKITLSLPSWMKSATPSEIPSLAQNDTAQIVLCLEPNDEMALRVPVTGSIGVNCENGDGLAIPFSIMPVSETTGILQVDVCDEFTYYTEEAPHVKDAVVTVRNCYDNKVVVQGKTDDKGLFSVELPEGYYNMTVTAEKHDTYINNILVDPGTVNSHVINLSYQAVTYSWDVVETEVEDMYEINTTVEFETNVPAPVVLIDGPKRIDIESMAVGESVLLLYSVTNKGLVIAKDVEIYLPQPDEYWEFSFLEPMKPFDLMPQQSVFFPVRFTRLPGQSRVNASSVPAAQSNAYSRCMASMEFGYKVICGKVLKTNRGAAAIAVGTCMLGAIGDSMLGGGGIGFGIMGGLGSPNGGNGGGGGGNNYVSDSSNNRPASNVNKGFCDPCQTELAWKIANCGISFLPSIGCAKGISDCATGGIGWKQAMNCSFTAVGCALEFCPIFTGPIVGAICTVGGFALNTIQCLISFAEPCEENGGARVQSDGLAGSQKAAEPDYMKQFRERALVPLQELTAYKDWMIEIFGSEEWLEVETEELFNLLSEMVLTENSELIFDAGELASFKPRNISSESFARFIERVNNTTRKENGQDIQSDNFVDLEKLAACRDEIADAEQKSVELGFESTQEMWENEFEAVKARLDESSDNVCASITLQFSQKMTMTRQAFRGTLTVNNGNENDAMQNVRLNLEVRDEDGNISNSLFQINVESLDKFEGNMDLVSGWSLDPKAEGTATVLFIPQKNAAPDKPKVYSFGGSLSYIDPFTGLEVTRNLMPVSLTVNPSPNLDMTYFMQRDVLGDDPLTDTVEPMVPAEFSLLINNKGNGDARNVRIVTEQPEIIDNEKGLLIDFELIGAQLNGEEMSLVLGGSVATDFGTIPAHSTAFAQWWFRSSLLGHFTDYDIEATHVTSYDNPDLSLLDKVTVHELVRSLELTDGAVGFMANDIVDSEDTPDHLYVTDGTVEEVATVSFARMQRVSDTEYVLTVVPGNSGWNYGVVSDPTNGRQTVESVTRTSDGMQISTRNFWQTDRTLRDGHDPLYENKIHFADLMTASEETYSIVFAPKPEVTLGVEKYAGIPEEQPLFSPLQSVDVIFNKAIDSATFTADDITLSCQGKQLDASLIGITKVTDSMFKLDLTKVALPNGYYVLTVQAAGIADSEGFYGESGKQASWIQYIDGKAAVMIDILPDDEAGTVTPQPGYFDLDSSVTLSAVPAEGYEFSCWMSGEEVVSTEPELTVTVDGDAEYTAKFVLKHFTLNVEYDAAGGAVEGGGTGVYDYGTALSLSAQANDGWHFDGWKLEGQPFSIEDTVTVEIKGNTNVSAHFSNNYRALNYALNYGWNWLTPVFTDETMSNPQNFVKPVRDVFVRLVGVDSEIFNDPDEGIVGELDKLLPQQSYKMQLGQDAGYVLEGMTAVPEETPVRIGRGWNWLGYIPLQSFDLSEAFSGLSPQENDIVKGFDSFSVYAEGKWTGTLEQLLPGNGYMYYSAKDAEFTYPMVNVFTQEHAPDSKSYAAAENALPWNVNKADYPDNMTVIAMMGDEGIRAEDYVVGAFVGDECRGAGHWVEDRLFVTVHGSSADGVVSFRAIDKVSGYEYEILETAGFSDTHVGTYGRPFALHRGDVIGIADMLYDGGYSVYPNPARERLYVEGDVAGIVGVRILSVSGAVVTAGDVYREESGIDVSALAQGLYMLEITTGSGTVVKPFIKE